MLIKTATFELSCAKLEQCPEWDMPEFAFIGRSNVGKSSLINYLTNHQKLAKVSASPGKTKLINLFNVNKEWILCDLPGYGYAKVSKKERAGFGGMINSYLRGRKNLVNVFVLIDSRIPPQKIDIAFINKLGEWGIPFNIIFTKFDKPASRELSLNVKIFKKELLKHWEEIPVSFISSAAKKIGSEFILTHIGNLVAWYYEDKSPSAVE